MNPRLTMRRHGRKIAVVGALVAVSATTTMALVAGTAAAAPSATQPGKCVDNVNVRAQPNTTSKIVAVCETGKSVQVDQTRNGFVHLADLKGWAAQEYVSVNGRTPSTPSSRASSTPTRTPDSGEAPAQRGRVAPGTRGNDVSPGRGGATSAPAPSGMSDESAGSDLGDQDSGDPDSGDQDSTDQDSGNQGAPAPAPAGLGGLLG